MGNSYHDQGNNSPFKVQQFSLKKTEKNNLELANSNLSSHHG